MPAPNLYVLHNHEEQIEDALVVVLAAHGLSDVLTPRSLEQSRDTRVRIEVTAGGALDHEAPDAVTNTGASEEDWFGASVDVEVATERVEEARSAIATITGKHAERVARARVAMTRGSLSANLPAGSYWDIVHTQFGGQAHAVDEQRGTDITVLSWAIQYRIRTDAWPT